MIVMLDKHSLNKYDWLNLEQSSKTKYFSNEILITIRNAPITIDWIWSNHQRQSTFQMKFLSLLEMRQLQLLSEKSQNSISNYFTDIHVSVIKENWILPTD